MLARSEAASCSEIRADVVVIGAGPAGLAAATELKRLGIERVIVIDREKEAGGVPRHCGHPPFGMREFGMMLTGPAYARRLVNRATGAGVAFILGCCVVAIDRDQKIVVNGTRDSGSVRISADRVILATGARETPRSARLISGDRPVGVLNTGALQAYVYLQRLAPFRRPVIVGTELVALSSLLTCRKIEATPVMMVESRDRPTVRRLSMALPRMLGVPVRYATEIVDIRGKQRVEAVTLKGPNHVEVIECDGVLMTGRFTPEASLARTAGLQIDDASRGPRIDQFARTTIAGVFAAGNVLRPVETAGWCWSEGRRIAGFVAADLAGELPQPERSIALKPGDGVGYVVPHLLVAERGGLADVQLRVKDFVSGELMVRNGDKIIQSRTLRSGPERRILMPIASFRGADSDLVFSVQGRRR